MYHTFLILVAMHLAVYHINGRGKLCTLQSCTTTDPYTVLCWTDVLVMCQRVFLCIQFKTIFVVCFIAAVLPLLLLKIFRVHFHGQLYCA